MRIHIILTGGTIGSGIEGGVIDTKSTARDTLLARYREAYGDKTDFSCSAPYTLLSENLTLPHLLALRDEIVGQSATADALIVTHGTDTLPHTAAALSYLLGLCPVPVVLVSANYVLTDARSNGVSNFAAAIAFLREAPHARGVFVAYGNSGEPTAIHRGSRLLSHLAPTDEVRSLDGVVATFDGAALTHRSIRERADEQAPFSPDAAARPTVLPLKVYPSMSYPTPTRETAAVLLETYHSGTLPTSVAEFGAFCADCRKQGIPLFAVGITGEALYRSATLFDELGIIPLPRMSPVAAYMKLTLALAAGLAPQKALEKSLGGDL